MWVCGCVGVWVGSHGVEALASKDKAATAQKGCRVALFNNSHTHTLTYSHPSISKRLTLLRSEGLHN